MLQTLLKSWFLCLNSADSSCNLTFEFPLEPIITIPPAPVVIYFASPSINKNSFHYYEYIIQDIFNSNDDRELFRYKFYIKNLYDNPLRKESNIDDDITDVRIEYKNNIYYYEISIYRLKMKNIDENNFTSEKKRKDIYHKGPLADNYFWDFLEFSYEVH